MERRAGVSRLVIEFDGHAKQTKEMKSPYRFSLMRKAIEQLTRSMHRLVDSFG